MATLSHWSGTEGPSYDPYAYEEWEFTSTDGNLKVELHSGLSEYCKVEVKSILGGWPLRLKEYNESAYALWERMTGLSPGKLVRYSSRIDGPPRKCPECGSKKRNYADGYPGETLTLCGKCNSIVHTEVNWSAIE